MNILSLVLIISSYRDILARTTYGRKPYLDRYREATYIPDDVLWKTIGTPSYATQSIKSNVYDYKSQNVQNQNNPDENWKIYQTSGVVGKKMLKFTSSKNEKSKLKFHHIIEILPDRLETSEDDSKRHLKTIRWMPTKTNLKVLKNSQIEDLEENVSEKDKTNIKVKHTEGQDLEKSSGGIGKFKITSHLHSDENEKAKLKYTDKKFHHVIEISEGEFEASKPGFVNRTLKKIQQTDTTTDFKELLKDFKTTNIMEDNFERTTETENIEIVPRADSDEPAEGSGEDMFFSNSFEDDKSGRLLGMFSRVNDTAPVCTTPQNETGHCRRFRQCLLSDALNNFNVFLQHLCLIRGVRVGICCPDNPVIEITNPEENEIVSDSDTDIKQPPEGCGLNVKTRIVGGTVSVPHEWSWMVALMRRNRFYCGGVIINNWYVLTAAHCVMGVNVRDIAVRLGEYNFSTQNGNEEDLSVAEIKRHAQFVTLTFQHDIALLKLRRSINYSKFVGSICLPTQTARDYSDVKGTVVGWGTVSFGGAASPVLRQVTIPVWKNEDCDRTYRLENIDESFVCAGSPEKGEDACQGDSGGPLMTLNERGRWEVIGIVSWGRRCGDPTYPGVYTRVTTYMDWINKNIT